MNYAQDLDKIARTLAVLAIHGTHELSESDFEIALVARASVLELATTVQFDLTGLRGFLHGSATAQLEGHPAGAFAVALASYPDARSRGAPSDALGRVADTDVGTEWQRVARHAISAHQHWTSGGYRPRDDVAWAGLADIAAICSVVAELDGELARRAEDFPGREDVYASLLHASTSGLRIAAREVSVLAGSGPLPNRGPEPRAPDNRGPVTITEAGDVARAHRQLGNLLSTARHVRPERLTLFVVGHLRTCRAVLEAWTDNGSELRAALVRHEQLLAGVTRHRLPAGSVDPGDAGSLTQAQIIRQACAAHSPLIREIATRPEMLTELAVALAETTVALQEAAERQVTSGAWVLVDQQSVDLRWTRSAGWQSPPQYVMALRAASVHATQVSILASPRAVESEPAPAAARPLHARDLLRPAPHLLLDPSRVPPRPPRPSFPAARHHHR